MLLGRLHVLTDTVFQTQRTHAALAERLCAGGVDTIQFRQKTGTMRERFVAAQATAKVCEAHHTPLLIDDHVDIALAVRAAGVHLGQKDFPIAEARRILGADPIVGATATTTAQALAAEAAGASYIGFGPVFPTSSKENPASVKGLEGLQAACEAVSIPVIAIAGITLERVPSILKAGAHGIAVMTAVTTAPDPAEATAAFRQAIDAHLSASAL